MKKITILLPAYNEEESISIVEKAMNSVVENNKSYE